MTGKANSSVLQEGRKLKTNYESQKEINVKELSSFKLNILILALNLMEEMRRSILQASGLMQSQPRAVK